jgi:hypothetical protein
MRIVKRKKEISIAPEQRENQIQPSPTTPKKRLGGRNPNRWKNKQHRNAI